MLSAFLILNAVLLFRTRNALFFSVAFLSLIAASSLLFYARIAVFKFWGVEDPLALNSLAGWLTLWTAIIVVFDYFGKSAAPWYMIELPTSDVARKDRLPVAIGNVFLCVLLCPLLFYYFNGVEGVGYLKYSASGLPVIEYSEIFFVAGFAFIARPNMFSWFLALIFAIVSFLLFERFAILALIVVCLSKIGRKAAYSKGLALVLGLVGVVLMIVYGFLRHGEEVRIHDIWRVFDTNISGALASSVLNSNLSTSQSFFDEMLLLLQSAIPLPGSVFRALGFDALGEFNQSLRKPGGGLWFSYFDSLRVFVVVALALAVGIISRNRSIIHLLTLAWIVRIIFYSPAALSSCVILPMIVFSFSSLLFRRRGVV